MIPYGDIPLGLPVENLILDHYDVDLTRRQLRSIDAVHRSTGRAGDLTRRILGVESPQLGGQSTPPSFIGHLNREQRQAVVSALNAPDFMVILGPPGTGKTAVIVEILAQLEKRGKRALAVSVTNTAVDNIVERLLDHGHRFGIRFGNWYKIRERAMQAALINIVTDEEDRALAAVEKMRTTAAVLTTCSSASLDLVSAGHFDVVLFEEASQIKMQDAFSALVQADKAIIIGDDKQLPPISQLHRQVNSLLEIALNTVKRHDLAHSLVTPLRVQYRMRREICDLVDTLFYDNTLISAPEIASRPHHPSTMNTGLSQLKGILDDDIAIALIDVEGVEEYRGHSIYNRINLQVDSLLIHSLKSSGYGRDQIGLITPYKEQQRLLSNTLRGVADIGTVDSFQGQERDIIILDLVRANKDHAVGFTLQPHRLNVALSRAREKLIIIANLPTFEGHKPFERVVDTITALPHTRLEQVIAEQLGIHLPEYERKIEIHLKPEMVDRVKEPDNKPPETPIPQRDTYFDVY